jgi:hypothetical protein
MISCWSASRDNSGENPGQEELVVGRVRFHHG